MTKRLLTPIALLLLIALAIGGWWSSRRSSATGSATIAAVAEAPPPSPPTESESTSLESVDPTVSRRASSAAELFASPALPTGGSGSIAGRVLSLDPGGKQVTAGFARIALAPAVPGSVRDEAEEQRLYIALPVAVIDREGRFTLPRVPLGEWIVSIEPDGFERRQTSVTVVDESPATPVEFHTVRALSTLLTVVLQDPTGAGLFEERSGLDLETKMALRTVFLEACPSLGSDLPAKPRELKYSGRERNPRPSGLWTTIAFPEPLSGCACVVLGTRVLDAAPFVAGQESVVLHVSVESIQRERRTLQVLVRDSAGLAPLPNAIVKFEPPFGRQRVQYSNSNGLATADDLLAGDLFVAVELAGYVTERVGSDARCIPAAPGAHGPALARLLHPRPDALRRQGAGARGPGVLPRRPAERGRIQEDRRVHREEWRVLGRRSATRRVHDRCREFAGASGSGARAAQRGRRVGVGRLDARRRRRRHAGRERGAR
jgi:hypothetical protein